MSNEVSAYCSDYILGYYAIIGSTIGIALSIVVVKLILKQIVIAIAKFQRYKDHTELSTNIMTNLMITYVCTTVLITFLVIIYLCSFKPNYLTFRLKILLNPS